VPVWAIDAQGAKSLAGTESDLPSKQLPAFEKENDDQHANTSS
jgi:hypothetical protein